MSWTARQRDMLGLMGLRIWSPPEAAAVAEPRRVAAAPAVSAPLSQAPSRTSPPPSSALAPGPPLRSSGSPLASSGGVDTLDWTALQREVADCTLCNLHAHRRQALFGAGHPQAQWLIVGDPPVADEDQAGQPFAGAAGQLLDRMLAALQLTRATEGGAAPAQRVFIVNALRCLPAPGDHPGAPQWAACEPYLVRQTALLQPRVMLAMGRFAAQALLRSSEPLGRLRSRVHRWRDVPLVVTYHPAFLLRNPDFKAAAWEDLVLAARCFEQRG